MDALSTVLSTALVVTPPPTGAPREAPPAGPAADLAALGCPTVAVPAADLPRALAEAPGDRVALVDARFVGHRHLLRIAVKDTRFTAVRLPGVLVVEGDAREALARVAAGAPGTVDDLAARLAATGTPLREPDPGVLVAEVPATAAERDAALARTAAVDEEAVRLTSAVKARDGFFTTFFVSTWSRYVARWCAGRGLTPNQVTVASLLVALAGAAGAATGTRAGYIGAALALYFSFVLDCTDGQLARYTVDYSRIGSWLDATFDRVKEYAVYAGLAFGAARDGDDVWLLAVAAMALQTTRHIVDFAFNETRGDGGGGGGGEDGEEEGAGARLSGRLDSVGWTVWARRMIILPIGERWALIAVLTATTRPRVVFVALLVGCGLAACYTTAGRVLRSLPRRRPQDPAVASVLFDLSDSGPLAWLTSRLRPPGGGAPWLVPLAAATAALCLLADSGAVMLVAAGAYVLTAGAVVARPLVGRLDWLVPPVLRAAEYTTVITLTARVAPEALSAAFGLVAVIAYHHYDTVYRLRGGHPAPPRAIVWSIGGHEGRVLLMAALATAGSGASRTGIAVFAIAAAVLVVGESVAFWVRGARPDLDDVVPAAQQDQSNHSAGPDVVAGVRTGHPLGTDGPPTRTGEPR
ncbi:DUF5941 domain-containing protein [Yinghuangia seranimata]|uniref:DUF5941 domain-containing protein n=1 Tax=Yinghuangia seranimata TaxID=408067 RepID=UPI00248CF3DA|nr:DUF5941 domain-containing protein [Yinghuangia seranimata]MDI2131716.1 DUF5941 domain-containing protein [Yinghuangia seranimata]